MFSNEVTRFIKPHFRPALDYDRSDPPAHLAELVDALVLGTSGFMSWEFKSPGGHFLIKLYKLN
jgi:hypothetical protein